MAMKCPACGGTLIYNVERNILKCEYCDSEFDPKQYSVDNDGTKTESYKFDETSSTADSNGEGIKVDRYLCKNCGAELCAPDEQIVSYCLYCGGEATLTHKADVMDRPTGIIPFKYSKEQVQKKYSEVLSHKPFVPKEFKDAAFLEGFRGIYIPYWRTRAEVKEKTAKLEGVEHTSSGSYDYTRYYDYTVGFEGEFESGSFDASETFDDTIAAEIAPFHSDQLEPFKESYLAGFYADKVTVPVETYDEQIQERMLKSVSEGIEKVTVENAVTEKEIKEKVSWNVNRKESLLFPVWFLTWKNKDRVAYSVMNGETGSSSIDVPVDLKKFFMTSSIVAVIIFAILSLLPTFFIPLKIASLSMILFFISGLTLMGEFRKIMLMETHAYDYGKKQEDGTRKKKISKAGCSSVMKVGRVIFIGFMLFWAWGLETPSEFSNFIFYMLLAQIVLCIRQCVMVSKLKKKSAIAVCVLCAVISAACAFAGFERIAADYVSYGIAAVGMIGMIFNIITCAAYINYLTTRPVPNFFTREGAHNGR